MERFFYSGGGEKISPLRSARPPNLNLEVVLENNTQITAQVDENISRLHQHNACKSIYMRIYRSL